MNEKVISGGYAPSESHASAYMLTLSFSEALRDRHDDLGALRVAKEAMQSQLRDRFGQTACLNPVTAAYLAGVHSLILSKAMRHGYHVLLTRKSEFLKVDKSKRLEAISEGRSVKAYAYTVSGSPQAAANDAYQVALVCSRSSH